MADDGSASVPSVGPMAAPAIWQIRILGTFAVERAGAALVLGGSQQRSVLLRLLLARGAAVPADVLLDQLWPDRRPVSATNTLHSYVSTLRRRLAGRDPEPVIVRDGVGYRCTLPSEAVDAFRFEQLLRSADGVDADRRVQLLDDALGAWGGAPFPEYADAPWATGEATRLVELHAVALERSAAARLDVGQAALVVPELEALVAQAPLREERWQLLALGLYRSGRQADALAAVRRAREVLAEELGIDPGPALRRIEADILAQAPELEPPARVASAPLLVPAADPPAPDAILERDGELALLRAWTQEVCTGRGRFVLIEGAPGVGKTRLLHELMSLVPDEALVLTARGTPLEKGYGFGVMRQLLEPVLADPQRHGTLLQGPTAPAAAVFDVATIDERGTDNAFAVLDGLYRLLVGLAADRPVVVAVDDLQWADAASLRALAYLVGRLQGLRILVVATRRDGETYDEPALYAEVAEHPEARVIRPRELTVDGVAELLRTRLGTTADAEFVRACHRATRGNPLLLRQLLRALEAERVTPDAAHADAATAIGSRAIANLVQLRLSRLGDAAAAVAAAVAVLGDRAELPTVAALAELDERTCADAVATLARAEVLRFEPPLDFVHPLVADAVERGLPPGVRELRHERAARLLAERHAPVEAIAAHLLLIPPRGDPWTVQTLRAAARDAVARGAADSAVYVLRRALEEPPDPATRTGVLAELGRVEASVDGPEAVGHLREAYLLTQDPAGRAALAWSLAQTLVFAGDVGEAARFATDAATELPDELVDARQGLAALARMCGYMHGLPSDRWRRVDAPWPAGDEVGARMAAAEQAVQLTIEGKDRARAVALARFAIADGRLHTVGLSLFEYSAINMLELADEDLTDVWAQAGADASSSPFATLSLRLWHGHALLRRGELRDAEHSLHEAIELTRRWRVEPGAPYSRAFAVEVALERGDVDGARALAVGLDDPRHVGDGGAFAVHAGGLLALAEGRWGRAVEHAQALATTEPRMRNPAWRPWRSLAAAGLVRLGRSHEAVELLEEELALAREWGAPRPIGRTLRRLADVLGRDGEPVLREALEVLAPTTARLELARAEAALAGIVAERDEAVALLRSAHRRAEHCGADALRARVAAFLVAHGEQP